MTYATPKAVESVHTFTVAAQSVDDGFNPDIRIDVFPVDFSGGVWFTWNAMDADELGANFLIQSRVPADSIETAAWAAKRRVASLFA